ncbi:MAG TPA: SDR family NAD(P)-dependent oxidoreductase, partial [Brevundimonas sp.]
MTESGRADAPSRGAALVTAASGRIGAVLAKAAAQTGYDVVVHYRSDADGAQGVVQAIEGMGRRAIAVQAELTDPDARAALMDQAFAFGPLRALVNNASLFVY